MQRKPKKQPPEGPPKSTGNTNAYDNILKERLRQAVPSLLNLLGFLPPGRFEEVSIEFPRTRTRRADFVAKYFGKDGYKAIAHVEFQSQNDTNMLAREFDYAAQFNYEYPDFDILQFVLLLGPNPPTMKTRLERRFFSYGYQLFWIKDIPYELLMASDKPELLLLAAFADYGGKSAATVFEEVAWAVKARSESKMDFHKFMDQLHIFSKLHKLQPIFKEVMKDILDIIDITDDWFYLEGEKKGLEKGEARNSLKVCTSLVKTTQLDDAQIALAVNLPVETVASIRAIVSNHPLYHEELVMNLFAKDK